MEASTFKQIVADVEFLLGHEDMTIHEFMTTINGYLLGLTQHKVITTEEQKVLGNGILNAYKKVCNKHGINEVKND